MTLHKKRSFSLRSSSVNMTKSAVSSKFGHSYWRNPYWKTSFFEQCERYTQIFGLFCLNLSRRRSLSYRTQSINLLSVDWLLYGTDLRDESVKCRTRIYTFSGFFRKVWSPYIYVCAIYHMTCTCLYSRCIFGKLPIMHCLKVLKSKM